MDGQVLAGMYKSWFNKLNPKEQRLFFALVIVSAVVFVLNNGLKPIYTETVKFNKEKSDIQSRIKLLSSQMTNIEKINVELEDIRKSISAKKNQADKMEAELLNILQIPQLLTQLVKCTQGLAIDFESVKQQIETDKQGFNRLYIDIKFTAKYGEGVNYIKRIEEISSFVKIEDVDIVQSKSDPRNLINVSMKLSSLLSTVGVSQAALSKCEYAGVGLKVERNPLMPKYGQTLAKKLAIKLTGITYHRETDKSTAIINDTVVRLGDIIEGYRVEKIQQGSVGVNDGGAIKELKIER